MYDLCGSLEFIEILIFLFKAEIESTMALHVFIFSPVIVLGVL